MANTIILVGTGYMAKEYAKVLKALNSEFRVVGRSEESTKLFKTELGVDATSGGIKKWLKLNKAPEKAIVAVTEDQLGIATRELLKAGCKSILVEKPGGFNTKEIKKISILSKNKKANVFVAYNRRFYASTLKALEIIKKEGILSFTFDFTERSYVVEKLKQSDKIKSEWFLHNSTHVIDMAFFIGGWPKKLTSLKNGKLSWHPSGSIYAGTGLTDKNALFSYHANWASAGRWNIEIMTKNNKLIFRPLEKLQAQEYGSMDIKDIPLDDKLDLEFKPGLYRQVSDFLGSSKNLLRIGEQIKHLKYFEKIAYGKN